MNVEIFNKDILSHALRMTYIEECDAFNKNRKRHNMYYVKSIGIDKSLQVCKR